MVFCSNQVSYKELRIYRIEGENGMKKKISIMIVLLITVAMSFYYIGYQTAIKKAESKNGSQTFYATITEMRENVFTVKGLEINDINFRGEFVFNINEDTALIWRGTKIECSDLQVNDHISITCTGYIQESDPAQIDVIQVQLLEDRA